MHALVGHLGLGAIGAPSLEPVGCRGWDRAFGGRGLSPLSMPSALVTLRHMVPRSAPMRRPPARRIVLASIPRAASADRIGVGLRSRSAFAGHRWAKVAFASCVLAIVSLWAQARAICEHARGSHPCLVAALTPFLSHWLPLGIRDLPGGGASQAPAEACGALAREAGDLRRQAMGYASGRRLAGCRSAAEPCCELAQWPAR